jgi:hypothetical protein
MHSPAIHKQLIESRSRELKLKSDAARAYTRQATVPRPRRWGLRSALAPSIARFAI